MANKNTVNLLKKGDILHITGRRWFQQTYGNTYHSATVTINGEEVLYIPFCYGYGDQYVYTAANHLHKEGYLQGWAENTPFWRYCQEAGIKLETTTIDVKRKKDL